MRVGIDGKVMALKAGGIGRYALNLLKGMTEILPQHPSIELILYPGPATEVPFSLPPRVQISLRTPRVSSSFIRSACLFPVLLPRENLDIFHGLDHRGLPLFHKVCPLILSVHDMITWVHPEFFTWKHRWVVHFMLPRMIQQADRIVTISHASREDIAGFFKIDPEKIVVHYLGCEDHFRPAAPAAIEAIKQKYRLPGDYVLFVGTLEPRKNLILILQALSLLKRRGKWRGLKLAVVGRRGWLYEEIFAKILSWHLEEDVLFLGFVDDRELPTLYSGSLFFIFPSFYEGFGLPVLEAMACGAPVISSNTSSLPEVAGDAAYLVDPRNAEELAWRMETLLESPSEREALRQKGMERAKLFSWSKAAQATLDLYQEMG